MQAVYDVSRAMHPEAAKEDVVRVARTDVHVPPSHPPAVSHGHLWLWLSLLCVIVMATKA